MNKILFYTVKRKNNHFLSDLFTFLSQANFPSFANTTFNEYGDAALFDISIKRKKTFVKCFCKAFEKNKEDLISAYICDQENNQLLFKTTSASYPFCLDYKKENGKFYSTKFNAKEHFNDNTRIV